jgi:hypothetical protein
MEIEKKLLEKKFKEYYDKTRNVATHVFVYSQKQKNIGLDIGMTHTNYIDGIAYSEMRSRDSDLKFGWEDVKFVAVGTYNDIKSV